MYWEGAAALVSVAVAWGRDLLETPDAQVAADLLEAVEAMAAVTGAAEAMAVARPLVAVAALARLLSLS